MSQFLPWRVLHVDVRDHLPNITADIGWGGVYTVVWCDRVPVGHLSIPASLLPLTSSQLATMLPELIAPAVANRLLRNGFQAPFPVDLESQIPPEPPDLTDLIALRRPLESCCRSISTSSSTQNKTVAPGVSLVICTRNRPGLLKKCLSSVRNLSAQPKEIIVVDNDPSPGLTQSVVSAFPEVRYVPESRRGLSAARNTGIHNSSGEIIAFTDDDVTVHSDWISTINQVFRDLTVIAMTGLVLPAELFTPAQYAFQRDNRGWGWGYRVIDFDDDFFRSMKGKAVPTWRMGAGANMAFRRKAFKCIGFFDERLGAGTSGCSEDTELWYRLLAEGYKCRYEPAAVVFHSHRSDWNELRVQAYNYMRGHVAALLFQFDRYGHWGNVYRAFFVLPFYFVSLSYAYAKKNILGFLRARKQAPRLPLGDQIRGMFAGYGYYLRYRHEPADHIRDGANAQTTSSPDR